MASPCSLIESIILLCNKTPRICSTMKGTLSMASVKGRLPDREDLDRPLDTHLSLCFPIFFLIFFFVLGDQPSHTANHTFTSLCKSTLKKHTISLSLSYYLEAEGPWPVILLKVTPINLWTRMTGQRPPTSVPEPRPFKRTPRPTCPNDRPAAGCSQSLQSRLTSLQQPVVRACC